MRGPILKKSNPAKTGRIPEMRENCSRRNVGIWGFLETWQPMANGMGGVGRVPSNTLDAAHVYEN